LEINFFQGTPVNFSAPLAFRKDLFDSFMNGAPAHGDIVAFRDQLGMSAHGFAKLMNVSPITVYRWEKALPKKFNAKILTDLRYLLEDLLEAGVIKLA
jgi:DNA-binding XRE family transcriptional regulator